LLTEERKANDFWRAAARGESNLAWHDAPGEWRSPPPTGVWTPETDPSLCGKQSSRHSTASFCHIAPLIKQR
jgi:hypothetical protein